VRVAVAGNKNISFKLMQQFACDKSIVVRSSLANNRNATKECLQNTIGFFTGM
jgi:hypothetical protein